MSMHDEYVYLNAEMDAKWDAWKKQVNAFKAQMDADWEAKEAEHNDYMELIVDGSEVAFEEDSCDNAETAQQVEAAQLNQHIHEETIHANMEAVFLHNQMFGM